MHAMSSPASRHCNIFVASIIPRCVPDMGNLCKQIPKLKEMLSPSRFALASFLSFSITTRVMSFCFLIFPSYRTVHRQLILLCTYIYTLGKSTSNMCMAEVTERTVRELPMTLLPLD
jgi:hypothetical protein